MSQPIRRPPNSESMLLKNSNSGDYAEVPRQDEVTMSNLWAKVAQAINSFVENPVTHLVKGMALLFIGLSEASRTFTEDLTQRHLRVGHGLIIIGFFGILEALPNLIDSLEAGKRYARL